MIKTYISYHVQGTLANGSSYNGFGCYETFATVTVQNLPDMNAKIRAALEKDGLSNPRTVLLGISTLPYSTDQDQTHPP